MNSSEAVALTQALVRVDTINPPGNESRAVALLKAPLLEAGFEVMLVGAGERVNLIAHLPADAPAGDRLPIAFTGHLDVVPLGLAAWKHDPFGGALVEGRLYGRGASDMKSGIAAIVCAARGFAAIRRRRAGVLLVLTAGEESGCDGARALIAGRAIPGPLGALVVAEPTNLYPCIAHKGALWVRLLAHGRAAHGSMPELGDNAISKLLPLLQRLPSLELGPAHEVQGVPTMNLGVIRGGVIPNQVPDRCEAVIDLRTVAGCDHSGIMAELRRMAGTVADVTTLLDVGPVATALSDPFVRGVFDLAARFAGERPQPRSLNYFTDAALLKPALGDPPTVIVGPGDPAWAHQTDEYVEVSRIDEAVELYSQIGRAWLA